MAGAARALSFDGRPFFVVLSADADAHGFEDLVAHELAHVWLEREPAQGVVCPTSFRSSTLRDFPMEQAPEASRAKLAEHRQQSDDAERDAVALVKQWGFADVSAAQ